MKDLLGIDSEFLKECKIVDWAYTEELRPKTYEYYLEWVAKDLHGPLKYLSDERKDKRKSLDEVYPGATGALVFLFDYRPAKNLLNSTDPTNKIAAYTLGFEGQDYHLWIREKLESIAKNLELTDYGVSLDVHPVLERDLAFRSGLGWFGKNSMIINREFGSYFLIGSLILKEKLSLNTKPIEPDHCGNCTRCIDACPTDAIIAQTRTIDSAKCISTFTIELFKDAPAPAGYPTESNEVFGCDICQEVCPWVKKSLGQEEMESNWLIEFFNRPQSEIYEEVSALSNKKFKEKFKHTSMERLGKRGLLKNLKKA